MTFTIDISSNVAYLHKFMADFERKHLPYAISRTINDIAVMSQERICKRIPTIFNVTRKWWYKNQPLGIKVNFSNRLQLKSSVFTRAYFAPLQEEGGIKTSQYGKNLAIPTVHIMPEDRNARTLKLMQNDPDIFRKGNSIYHRLSRKNLLRLYTIAPYAKIKPRLNFFKTVSATFDQNYDKVFTKRFNQALRTGR